MTVLNASIYLLSAKPHVRLIPAFSLFSSPGKPADRWKQSSGSAMQPEIPVVPLRYFLFPKNNPL